MPASSVAERALTVLYDEGCGFCTHIAASLVRHGRGRLRAAPIGSQSGAQLLRDLPSEERYASVHVVDERGRRWSGAASLPVLARATHGLRWSAVLFELVPGVTRAGYEWVTRHRILLSRLLGLAARRDATEP